MEFNEKLQYLRKEKGLTQEALAEKLYVSRTAVSKWESGRGYPSIDSLKTIATFFGISVDQLLSGEELLQLAEVDQKQKGAHIRDLVFGLLDTSVAMLFFLPFFGQKLDGEVQEVSLIQLTELSRYLKGFYIALVAVTALWGVLTLAMQNCNCVRWLSSKYKISLFLNGAGVLLFIISQQPYAAVLMFVYLIIKAVMHIKSK